MRTSNSERLTPSGIGLDIGGTKLEAAVVDQSGSIIHRDRVHTEGADAEALLSTLMALIDRVVPWPNMRPPAATVSSMYLVW